MSKPKKDKIALTKPVSKRDADFIKEYGHAHPHKYDIFCVRDAAHKVIATHFGCKSAAKAFRNTFSKGATFVARSTEHAKGHSHELKGI